jgi:hypothetical protein
MLSCAHVYILYVRYCVKLPNGATFFYYFTTQIDFRPCYSSVQLQFEDIHHQGVEESTTRSAYCLSFMSILHLC